MLITESAATKDNTSIAQSLCEATYKLKEQIHNGSAIDAINSSTIADSLQKSGFDMGNQNTVDRLVKDISRIKSKTSVSGSFSAGDNQQTGGNIDSTRYEISDMLIRNFYPEAKWDDPTSNPVADLLPSLAVNATVRQQDLYGAGYGMAMPGGAVMGVENQVPFLARKGKKWRGYDFTEFSEIDGDSAMAMRNLGSSDTTKNGGQQGAYLAQLNLLDRQSIGLIGRAISSITQGSFIATRDGTAVSSAIPSANIGFAEGTAGSWNTTTNKFTSTAETYTYDPLSQLSTFVNSLMTTGVLVDSIVLEQNIWNWIMKCPAVKEQTRYAPAFATDMAEVQRNLFKVAFLPNLMSIPIKIYTQGYKFADSFETDRSNTRPLWLGETVTSSSFRVLIKTKSPNGSIMGNTGFFPNVYQDGMFSSESATGIVCRAQDNSAFNMMDQRYIILTSTTYNFMNYQPNLVYLFDYNVSITS